MKIRVYLLAFVTLFTFSVLDTSAQAPTRPPLRDSNPCPGGKISAEIEPVGGTPGLDQLVAMSQLIVVGTVVNVLPPVHPNPAIVTTVETDSLIAVEQVLYGKLPFGVKTILLMQLGGKATPCSYEVPDDPLVQNGERYVFFLREDDRATPPNTTGSPRYFAAGYWSGKAKIVSGKIQFLPRSSADLHSHDNRDLTTFLDMVQSRVSLLPKR
jgi:hypothetical protein